MSDKKKLIKSVSLGSLCGVLGCVILMCIFAVIMLTSGLLGAELTDYIMVAVTALGALGGGFVAAKLAVILGGIAGGICGVKEKKGF